MSLLLQALQKASKTRDDAEGEQATDSASDDLSLEPIAEPTLKAEEPVSRGGPTAAQAATVLRAAETPRYSPLDWAQEHYMLTFLGAAILFAIGYGTYVYVQISNPAFLRSTPQPGPLQAAAPLPPPAAPQATAKISGLPVVDHQANNAAPLPSTTPQGPAMNLGAAATQPVVRERTRPTPKPRLQPAALSPEPLRSEDEEGLETIELPASPQVAALGTAESPGSVSSDRQDIAVRRQKGTAQEIDPTLVAAYQALVAGDYGRSRALYQEVLQADARSIDAVLGLAAIAWKEGRSEEASSLYGRILEIDPRNAHAQAGLIALVGGADPAAAELRLKQLIAREPSGFLYFTLGNLYAGQRQWPAAQQAYFQAYQFAPDNPDYAFNLAVGLEHLGQPNLALDYYRKALDLSFKKGRANFDQNLAIQRVGQLSARTN